MILHYICHHFFQKFSMLLISLEPYQLWLNSLLLFSPATAVLRRSLFGDDFSFLHWHTLMWLAFCWQSFIQCWWACWYFLTFSFPFITASLVAAIKFPKVATFEKLASSLSIRSNRWWRQRIRFWVLSIVLYASWLCLLSLDCVCRLNSKYSYLRTLIKSISTDPFIPRCL